MSHARLEPEVALEGQHADRQRLAARPWLGVARWALVGLAVAYLLAVHRSQRDYGALPCQFVDPGLDARSAAPALPASTALITIRELPPDPFAGKPEEVGKSGWLSRPPLKGSATSLAIVVTYSIVAPDALNGQARAPPVSCLTLSWKRRIMSAGSSLAKGGGHSSPLSSAAVRNLSAIASKRRVNCSREVPSRRSTL